MRYEILNELSLIKREGIPQLMDWLRDRNGQYDEAGGFFTAPASTVYHLSERGGLARHSWNVYQELGRLNDRFDLADADTIRICGLLHDVCKVGFYAKEMKRVRAADGSWSDKEAYSIKEQEPLGHGEKSVIILNRFISLTIEEELAIRWHMGRWDVSDAQMKSLNAACDRYKLVTALQLADVTASRMVEA